MAEHCLGHVFVTKYKYEKGHLSTNMVDWVMWLAAVVYNVIENKNVKFKVNMFDGIEDISICKKL